MLEVTNTLVMDDSLLLLELTESSHGKFVFVSLKSLLQVWKGFRELNPTRMSSS